MLCVKQVTNDNERSKSCLHPKVTLMYHAIARLSANLAQSYLSHDCLLTNDHRLGIAPPCEQCRIDCLKNLANRFMSAIIPSAKTGNEIRVSLPS